MPAPISEISGSSPTGKPSESRRWLKPRVPREQLYRLAPARPRPKSFGTVEFPERIRQVLRAWWAWLAAAIAFQRAGHWISAIVAGAVAFFQYHTSAETHPGV